MRRLLIPLMVFAAVGLVLSIVGLVRTMNRVFNQRGDLVLTYNPLRMIKALTRKA